MGRRIVSLLPSATETVAALGHAGELVGRSHECDFPPPVRSLPVVSRPRRDPVGTSATIHRGVVKLLREVLSIYEVDTVALRAADPDLIITQDLCRVCAVAESEVAAAARVHLRRPVDVLTSSPATLDDVLADVVRIGEALDDRAAADRLVAAMRGDLAELAGIVEGRDRPRVAVLDWADPPMVAGLWAPTLVELAGAATVLQRAPGESPIVTADELRDADPDVILVAPCGFGLDRAVEDHAVLASLPGWSDLSAVRAGRVAFADGSAYFNRPGPRLVTSAAIVTAVAHGTGPAVPLEGTAWRWAPGAGGVSAARP